jgi:hypothetical protein
MKKCRLLEYKNPVRTSHETHYVSATETWRLMLWKIWDFHDEDYEECRLLGYKNPVRTSQETHYISAKESSRLMLCKISAFQGGDYRNVIFVRTDVSEEPTNSILRVKKISEQGTALTHISILATEALAFLRSFFRLLFTANVVPNRCFSSNWWRRLNTFLRTAGPDKNHTALHPMWRHFS